MVEINDIIEQLPRKPKHPFWITRSLSKIEKIVVHYDGVKTPRPRDGGMGYEPVQRYIGQANYHISKDWNEGKSPVVRGFGLMYHYRVSADGKVWRTQPEELVTWHARNANQTSLAICCDLGPGQKPTIEQMAGLEALLNWLCFHRPEIPAAREDVWGHGELNKDGNRTACPGLLLGWVQAYRRG